MMPVLGYWFGIAWLDAILRLAVIAGVMTVVVIFLTYAERKVIARVQQRLGPTRTGPAGLLQGVADALKLVLKEDLRPTTADRWVFELAPFMVFVPVFLTFVAVPFTRDLGVRFLSLGLFYIVAVSSVNIVGFIMAGWGSDNKYALLGGVRAAAQMISYEVPLVLTVLGVAMVASSLDIRVITERQDVVPYIVWQPLAFVVFIIAGLAEMNRTPFDIPVAESEVVGGPTVEYSGIRWSFFQLAEYSSLFVLSALGADLFLGGYIWPFGSNPPGWLQLILILVKTSFMILMIFWVRATFPRLRIDQLMSYCWKVLIPVTVAQLFFNGLVLVYRWPDILLLVFSGALLVGATAATAVAVRRAARRPRDAQAVRDRRLQYARGA